MSITINTTEMQSAGLPPINIYRAEVVDGEERVSKNSGKSYFNVRFKFVETPEGQLDRPFNVYDNFFPWGKGLDRLNGLVTKIVGSPLVGDLNPESGEYEVSGDDLIDAIRGGKIWLTYFWERNDEGELQGRVGWKFATDPARLRMPKPL